MAQKLENCRRAEKTCMLRLQRNKKRSRNPPSQYFKPSFTTVTVLCLKYLKGTTNTHIYTIILIGKQLGVFNCSCSGYFG